MNAIEKLIQAAAIAATSVAAQAITAKQNQIIAEDAVVNAEGRKFASAMTANVAAPIKRDLLEKQGNALDLAFEKLDAKTVGTTNAIEALCVFIRNGNASLKELDASRVQVGTALSSAAIKVVEASNPSYRKYDFSTQTALKEKAVNMVPELKALSVLKNELDDERAKTVEWVLVFEGKLVRATAKLRYLVVEYEALGEECVFESEDIQAALSEVPLPWGLGAFRWNLSNKFELCAHTVKSIRDKIKAAKERSAKERKALKAAAIEDMATTKVVFSEDDAVVHLADVRALRALKDAARPSQRRVTARQVEQARRAL
jgi:hypothetical protein